MFKYVYKGLNRSIVDVGPENTSDKDKVDQYEDRRYFLSSNECWRQFEFNMSGSSLDLRSLSILLDNNQMIYFNTSDLDDSVPHRRTHLMACFEAICMPFRHPKSRTILFPDLPKFYT